MSIGRCCYDCAWCIMANAPMEAGVHWTCIHPEGSKNFEGQWDTPCMYFVEG